MKELEKHISERIEIHALKPIRKELKLLGKLKPKAGQKVYELDLKTGIISEAKFKNERIEFVTQKNLITDQEYPPIPKKVRDVVVGENCIYWPAINIANAVKQFKKLLGIK